MRTKEQFKQYVYAKADEKASFLKKSRAVWVRSVAAFSLLFIISGALIYGGFISGNLSKNESVTESGRGDVKPNGTYFYSKSMADGAMVVEADVANECAYGAVIAEPFSLSDDFEYNADASKNLCIQYLADEKRINGEEAIEIAKENCTIDYNQTNVYYDSEADVWKVVFLAESTAGNCQNVYMNGYGRVISISYGE